MHIDAKWVEHPHAYSHKMGERVNIELLEIMEPGRMRPKLKICDL